MTDEEDFSDEQRPDLGDQVWQNYKKGDEVLH